VVRLGAGKRDREPATGSDVLCADSSVVRVDDAASDRQAKAGAAVRNRIHPDDLLVVVVGTAAEVLEPLRAAIPGLTEVSVVPFDAE